MLFKHDKIQEKAECFLLCGKGNFLWSIMLFAGQCVCTNNIDRSANVFYICLYLRYYLRIVNAMKPDSIDLINNAGIEARSNPCKPLTQ